MSSGLESEHTSQSNHTPADNLYLSYRIAISTQSKPRHDTTPHLLLSDFNPLSLTS